MKTFTGTITANKMLNTVVVEIVTRRPHPLYKKLQKRSKKYKADTTGQTVQVGDVVEIQQTRPISKDKYFKIIKVITKQEEAK